MADTIDPLEHARRELDMTMSELWWRYFTLGGRGTQLEIEAMMLGALVPPDFDRDVLAVALNERFSELGGDHPLPYTDDQPP